MPNPDDMLRKAIRLAMNGRGQVEPNPMVGCVLASPGGQVIGEGYHARFGGPHAEPGALADCAARGASPAGATAYVTLEPCCHTDKKTPPCVPRLIEAGVARVVIGCLDPNPKVNGNGVAMLRSAGIEVIEAPADLAAECRQLIAPFLAVTQRHRPYVTLKWAQTADGHVAGPMGEPLRITGPESDRLVHALRARCDAVAVGTNTVLNDDPLLTARGVDRPRVVRRVVLSNTLSLPMTSRLVQSAKETGQPVLLYCASRAADAQPAHAEALRHAGIDIIPLPTHGEGRFSFDDALFDLARRGVTHLLVEPGPTLGRHLIARNQADRAWVFRSPTTLGEHPILKISRAPDIDWPASGTHRPGRDELTEYLNPRSNLFHANTPSADLVLAMA